jgi:hypothetical protein
MKLFYETFNNELVFKNIKCLENNQFLALIQILNQLNFDT